VRSDQQTTKEKSVTQRSRGTEKQRKLFLIILLAFLAAVQSLPLGWRFNLNSVSAQDTVIPGHSIWQVFLQRDVGDNGADQITFIDEITGESTSADVQGERYTLAGDQVIYFDRAANRVMLAEPDGTVRDHPFIQPGGDARRVDWLISPDGKLIVWTLVGGNPDALTTTTTLANLDGTNPRQVLLDGPRGGIRALPVAFGADNAILYMDFQPDGVGDFTPFPQFAGLFALDLEGNTQNYLPGEPGCFCGAALHDGLFLRLSVATDLSGFDLKVVNLAGNVEQTIPAIPLTNFTQAGDIVISPDGSKAVYAVAQIRDFGTADQSVRTVFILVDLSTLTQTPLTDPITTFVEPLMWTEDNTAIIFTSRQRDGTWKISLIDGTLDKIANATYLGKLG
jgi:hypothetical protein